MHTRKSVKGIITDISGKPVADAIVMIKEGNFEYNDIASVSNEKGEFYVSGIVIPGNYTLQIQHGDGTAEEEINVASPDTIIRINL